MTMRFQRIIAPGVFLAMTQVEASLDPNGQAQPTDPAVATGPDPVATAGCLQYCGGDKAQLKRELLEAIQTNSNCCQAKTSTTCPDLDCAKCPAKPCEDNTCPTDPNCPQCPDCPTEPKTCTNVRCLRIYNTAKSAFHEFCPAVPLEYESEAARKTGGRKIKQASKTWDSVTSTTFLQPANFYTHLQTYSLPAGHTRPGPNDPRFTPAGGGWIDPAALPDGRMEPVYGTGHREDTARAAISELFHHGRYTTVHKKPLTGDKHMDIANVGLDGVDVYAGMIIPSMDELLNPNAIPGTSTDRMTEFNRGMFEQRFGDVVVGPIYLADTSEIFHLDFDTNNKSVVENPGTPEERTRYTEGTVKHYRWGDRYFERDCTLDRHNAHLDCTQANMERNMPFMGKFRSDADKQLMDDGWNNWELVDSCI